MAFATRMQSRRPLATWILCGANALSSSCWRPSVGTGVELPRGRAADGGESTGRWSLAGEIWRLLSHAFLHGSVVHLLVNSISLFSLGGMLERLLGWRRFLVLYTVSALAGGLASAFVGGARLSVGASGAIFGLLGATFALVRPGASGCCPP